MAFPFVTDALGPRRLRSVLPSFQGPLDEGDGDFETFPCERCGSLTGLGCSWGNTVDRFSIVICNKCLIILSVERKLAGDVKK